MKRFAIRSHFWILLAILFSLSYAQVRIVSTSHSFLGTPVATPSMSSRTGTFILDWKNTDRILTVENAFIGISGIDIQTSIVNFSLGFISTTNDMDFTLQIKVGSNCAINSIQVFVLSTFDCKFSDYY